MGWCGPGVNRTLTVVTRTVNTPRAPVTSGYAGQHAQPQVRTDWGVGLCQRLSSKHEAWVSFLVQKKKKITTGEDKPHLSPPAESTDGWASSYTALWVAICKGYLASYTVFITCKWLLRVCQCYAHTHVHSSRGPLQTGTMEQATPRCEGDLHQSVSYHYHKRLEAGHS